MSTERTSAHGLRADLARAFQRIPENVRWYAPVIALGLALRAAMLPFITLDMVDHLLKWYERIHTQGAAFLQAPVSNYAPAYELYLWLVTQFDGLAAPATLIKLSGLPFEFSLAFAIAALVRACNGGPALARLGFCITFLMPTAIINGALWGQCDAVYVSFLAWSLWAAIKRKPILTMAMFSVALAFKLQAAFVGPALLWLWMQGRQPWWTFALAPVGYLLASLPPLLAGRALDETLLVYSRQAGIYHDLSMNAPSLYAPFPDSWYEIFAAPGVAVAGVAILATVVWLHHTRRLQTDFAFLLGAVALMLLAPFLTPKMHERYFFASDFILIAVALLRPSLWPAAVLTQAASLLSYAPFLLMSMPLQTWDLPPFIEAQVWRAPVLPVVGAVCNAIALFLLWRALWRERSVST
jgi:Gpi18-like mannosyltransferase